MAKVKQTLPHTTLHNTISSIYTTIHTTTTDIISDRNSISSDHRSEYTGTILHVFTG